MGLESVNVSEVLTILVPLGAFMSWVYWRLDKKFEKVDEKFIQLENRFDHKLSKIDERFDKIEEKFDKIDEKFAKVNEKFDKVDEKFSKMDEKMERGFSDLRQEIRQGRMETMFYLTANPEFLKKMH